MTTAAEAVAWAFAHPVEIGGFIGSVIASAVAAYNGQKRAALKHFRAVLREELSPHLERIAVLEQRVDKLAPVRAATVLTLSPAVEGR